MDSKLVKLNDEKAAQVKIMQTIMDKCDAEGRVITDEEQSRFNSAQAKVRLLEEKIKAHNELEERKLREPAVRHINQETADEIRQREGVYRGRRYSGISENEIWIDNAGRRVKAFLPGQPMLDYSSLPDGINSGSIGRYLRGSLTGNWKGAEPEFRMRSEMSGGSNVKGGFVIPNILSDILIDKLRNRLVLNRIGARTIRMESGSLDIARITGDATVEIKSENDAFSGSDLSFDRVSLNCYTLGSLVTLSRELFDDARNIDSVLENALLNKCAERLDYYFLRGSGSEQPLGILNFPDVQSTNDSVGAGLDYDEILDAIEDVRDYNSEPNSYVLSPANRTTLAKLKSGDGTNSAALYLQPPEDVQNLTRVVSNQMPDADVIVADGTTAIVGMRTPIQIETSVEAGDAFSKYQVKFRAVMRGDVALAHSELVTKLSGIS